MSEPALVIATVLYGGENVLADTLPELFRAARECDVAVVIVDNSPTEAPAELARSLAEREGADLRVTRRRDNPGFAASANLAVENAHAEWVFLVNADVTVRTEDLVAIREHIGQKRTTNPTAVSLVTAGVHTSGVELDRWGYFSDRLTSSSVPCLGPSGGAGVFHRDEFLRLGGFRAEFFAWGEDAEFALRLWLRGVRTDELELGLDHVGGHSVQGIATLRRKARWLARNRILLLRLDTTRVFRLVYGTLQLLLMIANGVLKKSRARTAGAHFAGIREGFTRTLPKNDVHPRLGIREFRAYRRGSA